MSEEMYKEIILDHYKNPRNKGVFPDAEVSAEDYNPVCGDRIRIDIMIVDDKVSDVKFDGEGCAISQASASILTDMLIDKSTDEILKLDKEIGFVCHIKGNIFILGLKSELRIVNLKKL